MPQTLHYEAAAKGTFLYNYLHAADTMESPRSYDFWCGMWVLSTLVGRDLVVDRPGAPVHMNLYTILCADAGTTRKSWSVNNALRVLNAAQQSLFVVSGNTTVEGLQHQMAAVYAQSGPTPTAICVSELVTLLGRENYTIGMPGLLTDLYDCPSERLVMRAGQVAPVVVKDAYVTFLSASTPAWLVRAVNPDVIEGGFTSRCLFIIEDRPKKLVAWPTVGPDTMGPSELATHAEYVAREAKKFTSGRIKLYDGAKAEFVKWYESRKLDANDPFMNSFFAREDHHVLRVAGLLAINEDIHAIDKHHIRRAIDLVTLHRDSAGHLFGSGKQAYRLLAGVDAIRAALAAAGAVGLSQSELSWKVGRKLNSKELHYLLDIMHELEMVQRFELSRKGTLGGRRRTVWRGTNRLMMKTVQSILVEKLST